MLTPEEQLELVRENWYNIKDIENPCPEAQMEAITQDSRARLLIDNLDNNILTIYLTKRILDLSVEMDKIK